MLASMDNLSAVKVGQSIENALGHFAQYFLAGPAPQLPHFAVDAV